jgi:hypothetical protein
MIFSYQKLPLFGAPDPRKPLVGRPLIPVFLVANNKKTPAPYWALLDSGADFVIFPGELAPLVGIEDVETGRRDQIIGVAGQKAPIYYHDVNLQVAGDTHVFPITVGFSSQVSLPLLGRTFFARFKQVVFEEMKERLELRV